MSDVLPEWGIKLRKMVDRMVPFVNEHNEKLHAFEDRCLKLEARLAQAERTIREQETKIGLLQAKTFDL